MAFFIFLDLFMTVIHNRKKKNRSKKIKQYNEFAYEQYKIHFNIRKEVRHNLFLLEQQEILDEIDAIRLQKEEDQNDVEEERKQLATIALATKKKSKKGGKSKKKSNIISDNIGIITERFGQQQQIEEEKKPEVVVYNFEVHDDKIEDYPDVNDTFDVLQKEIDEALGIRKEKERKEEEEIFK